MKLIVGLGNPGKEYKNTRHNVGFDVVDEYLKKHNQNVNKSKFEGMYSELIINGEKVIFLEPQKYMNLSGEVITTPFSFASTTHAIVQNGLTPVFCDINEDDYTIDVNKIEELITEKTTAIVPVHVYGHACDVETIEKIAKKHNLKVIYDAAHVFGVEVNGRGIGSYGDISCNKSI